MTKPKYASRITTEAEFLALIEEVDAELKAENVPIEARTIQGWIRVAQRTKEDLPFIGDAIEGVFTGSSLAGHVGRWFKNRYGDRLKIDFSPGSILLLIRGDLFLMRLPRVFGSVMAIADRIQRPRAPIFQSLHNGVPEFNVLDLIEGLAEGLRAVLTDEELRAILKEFYLAMNQTMECEAAQQLFEAISLDLKQGAKLAVEGAFGYSRYHSLQAAEKALKAFIAAKGAPVRKIHVLKDLHECAVGAGMRPLSTQWLQSTQCSAGVRYGEENSTSADAFEAHSAARMIVFEVAHQLPRKQKQS